MNQRIAAGVLALALIFSGTANADESAAAGGCSVGRSSIGGIIGIVIGTLLLPGIGSLAGGALAASGTCGYDAVRHMLGAAPVAGDSWAGLAPGSARPI